MRLGDHLGPFRGIEGLPLILVLTNAFVYILSFANPELVSRLMLEPVSVWSGELWRLLTFLFVPPPMHPIWFIFWAQLFYLYADALDHEWGSYRFTMYYLVGAVATAAVGFYPAWGVVPNVYLEASLLLAFATLFPHYEIYVFFVLPVKVKYLGYLTWTWLAWTLLFGPVLNRLAVLAALLNYFLFFGKDLWEQVRLRFQSYQARRRWDKSLRDGFRGAALLLALGMLLGGCATPSKRGPAAAAAPAAKAIKQGVVDEPLRVYWAEALRRVERSGFSLESALPGEGLIFTKWKVIRRARAVYGHPLPKSRPLAERVRVDLQLKPLSSDRTLVKVSTTVQHLVTRPRKRGDKRPPAVWKTVPSNGSLENYLISKMR